MSNTSRNNSSTSLMGFSVHQPSIGSPLQFFPAMGSKQLDEMIDAYVPGNVPIADKRATVSMEFFEHSMATGELFKFFMVYPSLGSATESPSGSMLDSGYGSSFTSPVMSESQWTQAGGTSLQTRESAAGKSSAKRASLSNDFSHLPGMKIITKDGKDVTNMTSRGCKTKEQRDHAHLMRIIKACDSSMSESLVDLTMDWNQFIQFDEEPTESIPFDYDFFHDPQGLLSPTSYNSFSSSQPITPAQTLGIESMVTSTTEGEAQVPLPPYLNPGGEAGNSYADFDLYSPGSSTGLEDDPSLSKEVAAMPIPDYVEYANRQRPINSRGQDNSSGDGCNYSTNVQHRTWLPSPEQGLSPTSLDVLSCYESGSLPAHNNGGQTGQDPEWRVPVSPGGLSPVSPANSNEPWPQPQLHNIASSIESGEEWIGANTSLPRPNATSHGVHKFQLRSPSLDGELWINRPTPADQQSQRTSVAMLTSGAGTWTALPNVPVAPMPMTTELFMSLQEHGRQTRSVSLLRNFEDYLKLRDLQQKNGYSDKPRLMTHTHEYHVTNETLPSPASLSPSQKNTSHTPDGISLSPVSSLQLVQVARNAPKKTTSSYAIISRIEDAHESNNSANANAASLTAQDVAVSGANKQSDHGGRVPSVYLLGTGNSVFHSGALVSALAMTTLYALPFLLAIGTALQSLFFRNSAEKFETTPASAGSLPVASASIKLRQRATKHADTLDLSAKPLSYLGRLPFAVSNSIKSRYSQFPECLSRIHCSSRERSNLQRSDRMCRLQRMTIVV
ncbi:hypothetical protein ABKA04_007581 [Annulohypoxylon sp. FPYF3050]